MARVHVSKKVLESEVSVERSEDQVMDVEIPPRDPGSTIYATEEVFTALDEGRLQELLGGKAHLWMSVRPGDRIDVSTLNRVADEADAEVVVVLAEPEVMGA